jgi:hypothetical protein
MRRGQKNVNERRRPLRPLTYQGPAARFEYRLSELKRHRTHITTQLHLLRRLVKEFPELREAYETEILNLGELRLVVDNGNAPRRPLPRYRPGGHDAA